MPANLTPQYHKAEQEYRRAQTADERVECLERLLQLIPKHKGTEKLQADLKSKLKESRADLQTEKSAPKGIRGVRIPRQGAGTVLIIGAPNSGKSRLLAELTNADPEVADYPFTTRTPLPGMMPWEDVRVQLIDTPPITASHLEPSLLGMVRSADAAILCFDGSSDDAPDQTAEVLQQLSSRRTRCSTYSGFDPEDLGIVHVRTLLVITRGNDSAARDRVAFLREMQPDFALPELFTALDSSEDVNALRDAIYDLLGVIRVYTKRPGKPAEYVDPFTLPVGGTIEDLAIKVHRDLAGSLKFAKVWSAQSPDGQTVSREHVLADRDMVELHH